MRLQAESLRRASEQDRFPYRERHVTFLRISAEGPITQAKGAAEKREMLGDLGADDMMLAAWTGNYTTDIFLVDDVAAARTSLG